MKKLKADKKGGATLTLAQMQRIFKWFNAGVRLNVYEFRDARDKSLGERIGAHVRSERWKRQRASVQPPKLKQAAVIPQPCRFDFSEVDELDEISGDEQYACVWCETHGKYEYGWFPRYLVSR